MIGHKIRMCVYYKEFKKDGIIISTHSKYEDLEIIKIIDLLIDHLGGRNKYTLEMSNGMNVDYFTNSILEI